MLESLPQNPKNPFELVEYDGMLVPQILTTEGREKDLEDYARGWRDQSKNSTDLLVPNTIKDSDIKSATNWYEVGAVKRYQKFDDRLSGGAAVGDHEKDLLDVMKNMRTNGVIIPDDAWSNDDEDGSSERPRFS